MQLDNKEIYFIIFNNIFYTNMSIDVRYDLKGSLYSRTARNEKWNSSIALKDLDFLEDKVHINM
jgi:hypothetical protein